jgi:bacteriorhodopsin
MKLFFYKIITLFILVLILTEIGFEMINAQDSFVSILGFILVVVFTYIILIVATQKELPQFKLFGCKSSKNEVDG